MGPFASRANTAPASEASAEAAKTVDLARVGMPRLLFALLHQRFTGELRIEADTAAAGPHTVWLRGGMPVAADRHLPEDALDRLLVELRVVREPELAAARKETGSDDAATIASYLVEHAALDATKLREARRIQCFRALLPLFALRQGRLTAISREVEIAADAAPVNVLQLIADGVALHYDEARVLAEAGSGVTGPLIATASLQRYREHFGFPPADAEAVRAIAAGTDVKRLHEHHRVAKPRAYQIVYTLWACQMLKPHAPAATQPASRSAPAASPRPAQPRREPSAPPSTASADPAFAADLEALERKIADHAHPFALLDVSPAADKREIRRAWSELSVKFHPDGLAAKGTTHLRDRVNAVFAALSEAHQLLSDREQRERLREKIERGESTAPGNDATAVVQAALHGEVIIKEADKLLRAGKFELALERYREASAQQPDEPDVQAAIAWCEYNLSDRDRAAAIVADRKLAAVLESAPNLARAHYFRGFIFRALGAVDGAIKSFDQALALDRRMLDAERQARALRMQKSHASAAKKPTGDRSSKGLKALFGGRKS